jgi:hypothetical protein
MKKEIIIQLHGSFEKSVQKEPLITLKRKSVLPWLDAAARRV